MKELEELAMKLGEAIYAQQQAQGAAGQPGADAQQEKKNDDGIVDAEVVD